MVGCAERNRLRAMKETYIKNRDITITRTIQQIIFT